MFTSGSILSLIVGGAGGSGLAGGGGGGSFVFQTYVAPTAPVPGPVPEPATWGMMIIGLGGIGTLLRRRRNAMAQLPHAA